MYFGKIHKYVLRPNVYRFRSSHPKFFLGKGVLQICSKLTGEHLCRSAISMKLQSNFIEIALRHGCSPVNLLHIFRTPFPKNTSEGLLLEIPNLALILHTVRKRSIRMMQVTAPCRFYW